MNSRKMTTSVLLLLALTATTRISASEGFYAGAAIGTASLNEDFDGLNVDDDTTAFRIVGGWQINEYFALEAGYQNFGDFEETFAINGVSSDARLSADGFVFGVQGQFPISPKVATTGRLGAFFWDGEAQINDVSQADPGDTNPYFGVGLSYHVNDAFSITGDWTRYELEDTSSNVFSAGFQFRFGSER